MEDKIKLSRKFDLGENYAPSDSENEYTPVEKRLLEKARNGKRHDSDEEEEMYAFSDSDSESDHKKDFDLADSDVEGQEASDDDLPDSKAWGKKKRSYYSTDYVDQDYGGFAQDEEAATLEEEEAKVIQKRLIEQMGDEDFNLDYFTEKKPEESREKEIHIKSDLSQLSKRQKIQLHEKESPEFAGLVEDFKTKINIVKDDLKPVVDLIKDGKFPACPAAHFIKTNYSLILNYCTNISFYLLLKAKRISIQNHPVIKRLYQYRQMFNQIEPIYEEVIKPQIEQILTAIANNEDIEFIEESVAAGKRKSYKPDKPKPSKKLKLLSSIEKSDKEDTGVSDDEDDYSGDKTEEEDEKIEKIKMTQSESEESGFSDNEESEKTQDVSETKTDKSMESLEKREITYQMAKNKGLTPYRKKDLRNPRVKHKLKYKKAKIRRKGAVREVRSELSRYGGEVSGIKANLKKSIRIK